MNKFNCDHMQTERKATLNFKEACPFCVEELINAGGDKDKAGVPELEELQARWAAMVGNVCPYGCGNLTKLVATAKCKPAIQDQVVAHAYCYACQLMVRADWNYEGQEPVKTLKTISPSKPSTPKQGKPPETLVNAKSIRRAAMYAIPYKWRWIAALFN